MPAIVWIMLGREQVGSGLDEQGVLGFRMEEHWDIRSRTGIACHPGAPSEPFIGRDSKILIKALLNPQSQPQSSDPTAISSQPKCISLEL